MITFLNNPKKTLVVLRWLSILMIMVLLGYSNFFVTGKNVPQIFSVIIVLILSNIAIMLLPKEKFVNKYLYTTIFVVDVALVSLSIYLTHGFQSDLYLVYFIIIFMASSGQDIKFAIPMAIIASVVYAVLLVSKLNVSLWSNPLIIIRIPFLFIMSLIFLYYAQEERRRVNEQMERMEKLSMVGEMVAGIVHELNTPLTTVVGFAEVIDSAKDLDEKELIIGKISNEAKRAKTIISSIIKFMYEGKPERTDVNVNEIIDTCLLIIKDPLLYDKVQVEKVLVQELPKVYVDSGQIQQVILNILNNAKQAMKTNDENNRKITIFTELAGNHIKIKIHNNGPAISSEVLTKVFEPFYTTKKRGEGTGLGLTISYRIMKQNDGNIYVKSSKGQGVSFYIELPVSKNVVTEK